MPVVAGYWRPVARRRRRFWSLLCSGQASTRTPTDVRGQWGELAWSGLVWSGLVTGHCTVQLGAGRGWRCSNRNAVMFP